MKERAPKVLIADGGDILRTGRTQFLIEGYEAAEAADCATLIELAHTWAPNVVLLDLEMPSGEGRECLERVRSTSDLAAIPLVVLTDHPDDAEQARAMGAFDVVLKPVGPISLLNVVKRALGVTAEPQE